MLEKKFQNKSGSLIFICLIILTLLIGFTFRPSNFQLIETSSSYITRGPISISSDAAWASSGFPGSGTTEDPYRIENYRIITTEDSAIQISLSNKKFLIQNCYLQSAGKCISIGTSSIGSTIYNNTIIDSDTGISFLNYGSFKIINNTIQNNRYYGLSLQNCGSCLVENNSFIQNGMKGIDTNFGSSNTVIKNNHFLSNGEFGIDVSDGSGATITGNLVQFNGYTGILAGSSATITDNTCNYNGESGFSSNGGGIIENNTCVGNYYGIRCDDFDYIKNCSIKDNRRGVFFNGNQITMVNCTIVNNFEYGIRASNTYNLNLTSNTFKDNYVGARFFLSDDTNIEHNQFFNDGIVLEETHLSFLSSYTFSNNTANGKGIVYYVNQNDLVFSNPNCSQILLAFCENVQITNQLFNRSDLGIQTISCTNITINSSQFLNLDYRGIYHLRATSISTENCSFINISESGIHLNDVENLVVNNNTFLNANYGIYCYYCLENKTIINNNFSNSGIEIYGYLLEHYWDFNVSNNLVNSKPLLFVYNQNDILFNETLIGQIFLINCTEITVMNLDISKTCTSLTLFRCTNISVSKCNLSNNYAKGIFAKECNNLVFSNITASYNNLRGIELDWCNHQEIYSCIFDNNTVTGIRTGGNSPIYFLNNSCTFNGEAGAEISSSNSYFENNTFRENTIGIESYTSNSIYVNNTIANNIYGILFQDTYNDEIFSNIISENIAHGIFIGAGSGSEIYNNTFYHNNIEGTEFGNSQALDIGSNVWYNVSTLQGNWWSDYDHSGSYAIDGGVYDLYPSGPPIPVSEFTPTMILTIPVILYLIIITHQFKKKKKKNYVD